MHQLERYVRDELAAQRAAVQLHPDGIRDDDTGLVAGTPALGYQRGRRQIHVVVLKTADGILVKTVTGRGSPITFSRPSSAMPLLSLLLDANGTK